MSIEMQRKSESFVSETEFMAIPSAFEFGLVLVKALPALKSFRFGPTNRWKGMKLLFRHSTFNSCGIRLLKEGDGNPRENASITRFAYVELSHMP